MWLLEEGLQEEEEPLFYLRPEKTRKDGCECKEWACLILMRRAWFHEMRSRTEMEGMQMG